MPCGSRAKRPRSRAEALARRKPRPIGKFRCGHAPAAFDLDELGAQRGGLAAADEKLAGAKQNRSRLSRINGCGLPRPALVVPKRDRFSRETR